MSASSLLYGSWSRLPRQGNAFAWSLEPGCSSLPETTSATSLLPRGAGRTYGDTCVNPGGGILDAGRWNRILDFDSATGIARCEAGVTLGALIDACVPRGWFPPVCPGTRAVTVGGMTAHDVHGKDQPASGTFGRHVEGLDLWRSDGATVRCGPREEPRLFAATVGGLGLTGLIKSVDVRLRRITGDALDVEHARVSNLAPFLAAGGPGTLALDAWMRGGHDHALMWVDSWARPTDRARAVLFRARAARSESALRPTAPPRMRDRLVPEPPAALFNRTTMRLVNRAYHWLQPRRPRPRTQHFSTFIFPQDDVHPSNRMYGMRGVYAYHCLVPPHASAATVPALLERASRPGDQSLVTVMKPFGGLASPGMLSFSGPGISLVLGFPNEGEKTLALLADLDTEVVRAGGKLYPAKDARMPAAMFRASFPRWEEFAEQVDPRFSSSFWRRVAGDGARA